MEQWKTIKGYEGFYEVSNLGNVRSVDRVDSIGRKRNGKLLSPSVNQGYLGVNLCKDSKPQYLRIHKLVAEAFLIKKENDEDINHINGIRNDNKLENLEYCTHKENLNKAVEQKHRKTNLNQLSDDQIINILKDFYSAANDRSKTMEYIIKKYNIKKTTLRQIAFRKSEYMSRIQIQNFEITNVNKNKIRIKSNIEIMDLRKHGFYLKDIAEVYGLELSTISKICEHLKLGTQFKKYKLL